MNTLAPFLCSLSFPTIPTIPTFPSFPNLPVLLLGRRRKSLVQ